MHSMVRSIQTAQMAQNKETNFPFAEFDRLFAYRIVPKTIRSNNNSIANLLKVNLIPTRSVALEKSLIKIHISALSERDNQIIFVWKIVNHVPTSGNENQ